MNIGLSPVLLPVSDMSQAAEARRIATQIARTLDFDEERTGRVAIVAVEVASNLVKHARDGRLQIRACGDRSVEIVAFDSGPGISDTSACLRDGFSTAGTPGTGLGAVRRLASEFDLFSQPRKGTVVLARVHGTKETEQQPAVQVGIVQVPARGESVCGDAWAMIHESGAITIMVADGLGHGPLAAEAAEHAARIVNSAAGAEPADVMERIHRGLRSTRGAAVAVARIQLEPGLVRYAGLGNISALVFSSGNLQRLVSHNGTAGAQARRIQQFEYGWPADGLLVMYSDGLTSHWDLSTYPGLWLHDPAVIAAVLYRDHNRGRDDAIIVALKAPP